MKTFIHEFKGFGIHPSKCKVHIEKVGSSTWIGFEDLGEGTSVTNASEQLATEIVDKVELNPSMCKFFEWYPQYEGDLDRIEYKWKGPIASQAEWSRCCIKEENPFITGQFPFDE
jgi:hypothetical protein